MTFYSEFAAYYEEIFPFRDDVYTFLKKNIPAGGRRVLDMGCGPGHYCGRFAAEGFEAEGIDLDPAMIESARGRYPQAEFLRMNLSDVPALAQIPSFDLIFCIGNTAAHLKLLEFQALARGIKNLLKPGGSWIFQVVNWDYILNFQTYHFPPKTVRSGNLKFLRTYQNISKKSLRFRTCLQSREKLLFEGTVRLYPVPDQEYRRIHDLEGFQFTGHHADYQGQSFDPAVNSANIYIFSKY